MSDALGDLPNDLGRFAKDAVRWVGDALRLANGHLRPIGDVFRRFDGMPLGADDLFRLCNGGGRRACDLGRSCERMLLRPSGTGRWTAGACRLAGYGVTVMPVAPEISTFVALPVIVLFVTFVPVQVPVPKRP